MAARVLDCPQCGAPVTFRSSIAVFAVCESCGSMVVPRGEAAERIGEMAALPPDLSPFQIGTHGEWQGKPFAIIGRLRIEWEQGSWNEWCILYDGKTSGWLAEAQGLLMVSFLQTTAEELPSNPSDYPPSHQIKIAGQFWKVTDLKVATYRAAEGELPFPIQPGQQRLSADLTDAQNRFASIELSADGAEFYLGEYVEFDALRLSDLRPVPGWSAEIEQEKNRTTALTCPSCGGTINLRAAGQSMSAVCGSCGSLIDTSRPELKIIEKAEATLKKIAPVLPIGQRGKLFGTDYEVIGLVRRVDQYSDWSEYLLFNPWKGFRWLVTYNGHWSFVTRLTSMPKVSGRTAYHGGRKYRLFGESTAVVRNVLGEFYWKVRSGEQADLADFIAPPYILSRETYPQLTETAWSHGEYLDRKVVANAFAIKNLAGPSGIYLNQPNRARQRLKEVALPAILAVLVLTFVQLISAASMKEAVLTQASFVYNQSATTPRLSFSAPTSAGSSWESEKVFSTPHFHLEGGPQRVVVDANAPVDNNWIGLDLDLINAKTNVSYPAALEVSAYHGYDSDGAWREGSQQAAASFPAVPPGEYYLTVEPSLAPGVPQMPFQMRVRSGGVFNSNFFIMLGLVLFYPATLIYRSRSFEQRRWAESDFTP